jgi:murein DD-endopeptidase MepM/ murein hydrolase activator NlpD
MQTYPRTHLKTALLLAAVLAVVITTLPAHQVDSLPEQPVSLELLPELPAVDPVLAEADLLAPEPPPPETRWIQMTVRTGDSLSSIFSRLDLPAADLHYIMELGRDVSSLRRILPGQDLSFELSSSGELQSVRYKKDAFDTLIINRTTDGFAARWDTAEPETLIAQESARITKSLPSLYHAGKDTGLSDNIIMKLSYIFQWDVSFALDLRTGDSFDLMYEKIYVDGEFVKEGDIIAATFSNNGRTHQAVRYIDSAGHSDYYTPEGLSMRKAFIRDPVHFSYVSSSFNLRRLHPVHKRVMPHRGIDYAANRGTPVVAAGDGKISIRRRNDAAGNYVVIQHGQQYTTKYLHLSAFARGVKPGASVRQGQTIGYVGATGWATGPHLHYEFLVNGVHRNPKTVSLPKASPIAKGELQRFKASISPVLAQLEAISGRGYARSRSADQNAGG